MALSGREGADLSTCPIVFLLLLGIFSSSLPGPTIAVREGWGMCVKFQYSVSMANLPAISWSGVQQESGSCGLGRPILTLFCVVGGAVLLSWSTLQRGEES